MIPCSFDESTHCIGKPPDMTDEQCDPLSVCNAVLPGGFPAIVSCWKLTKDELEEFQQTGRVWLMVCGTAMPPVILSGVKPF